MLESLKWKWWSAEFDNTRNKEVEEEVLKLLEPHVVMSKNSTLHKQNLTSTPTCVEQHLYHFLFLFYSLHYRSKRVYNFH